MTLKPGLLAFTLLISLPAGTSLAQEASEAMPPPAAPAPSAEAPAPAPAPEASLAAMIGALSKFLTEEELQMVYDYLWDSSIAALKGDPEEVVLPPELAFKLAILQRRIVKEGGHYLEGLARKMDQDLERWRQDMMKPPAPVPYSLPGERPAPTPRP